MNRVTYKDWAGHKATPVCLYNYGVLKYDGKGLIKRKNIISTKTDATLVRFLSFDMDLEVSLRVFNSKYPYYTYSFTTSQRLPNNPTINYI